MRVEREGEDAEEEEPRVRGSRRSTSAASVAVSKEAVFIRYPYMAPSEAKVSAAIIIGVYVSLSSSDDPLVAMETSEDEGIRGGKVGGAAVECCCWCCCCC